jgi:hypothetical protein
VTTASSTEEEQQNNRTNLHTIVYAPST